MTGARLKHYGWGREGEGMSAEERKFVLGRYRAKFATDEFDTIVVPGLDDLSLREPRMAPPAPLTPFARPTATIALRTPTASPTLIASEQCLANTIVHPTLWPIRATRPRFRP
jgi:hypothetical protein